MRRRIKSMKAVETPESENSAPTATQDAAGGVVEAQPAAAKKPAAVRRRAAKKPAAVRLRVAKNWRCLNPALLRCVNDADEECLVRVPPGRRDNFRERTASGEPMLLNAVHLVSNLYVIEGACPRWPGRW